MFSSTDCSSSQIALFDPGRGFLRPSGQLQFDLQFWLADALEVDLERHWLAEGKREFPLVGRHGKLVVFLELATEFDEERSGIARVEPELMFEVTARSDGGSLGILFSGWSSVSLMVSYWVRIVRPIDSSPYL